MAMYPNRIADRIVWAATRAQAWIAHALSLQLTTEETNEFDGLVGDLQQKHNSAIEARAESATATSEQNQALEAMTDKMDALIKKIKGNAAASDNPKSFYQLAQISEPKPAAPLPAPITPSELVASLNTLGQISLTWKGDMYGGTFFVVERQTVAENDATGAWTPLASVSEKTFTDENVPTGFKAMKYRVRASRNNLDSANTANVEVNFGVASPSLSISGEQDFAQAA